MPTPAFALPDACPGIGRRHLLPILAGAFAVLGLFGIRADAFGVQEQSAAVEDEIHHRDKVAAKGFSSHPGNGSPGPLPDGAEYLQLASTVNISTENSAPRFGNYSLTIRESFLENKTPAGTRIGVPLLATDKENHLLTYSLTDASGRFGINPVIPQVSLRVATNFDYELLVDGVFATVTVHAQDILGARGSKEITIRVTDVREAEYVPAIQNQIVATGQHFFYRLGVIRDGSRQFSYSLHKPEWLGFRIQNNNFNVHASSSVLERHVGAHTISVQVTEGDVQHELETFVLHVYRHGRIYTSSMDAAYSHNPRTSFGINLRTRPYSKPVTLTITGDDVVAVSPNIVTFNTRNFGWARQISVLVQPEVITRNQNAEFTVVAKVAGHVNSDLSYRLAPPATLRGRYIINNPPLFRLYRLVIFENILEAKTPAGAKISVPLFASDPEGHKLTYSLTDASGRFDIDPTNGWVSLTVATNFDYELLADGVFATVTVHAQDSLGARGSKEVEIEVLDKPEASSVAPLADQTVVADEDFVYNLGVRRDGTVSFRYFLYKPEWLEYKVEGNYFYVHAARNVLAGNIGTHTVSVALFAGNLPRSLQKFALTVVEPGEIVVSGNPVLRFDRRNDEFQARLGSRPAAAAVTLTVSGDRVVDASPATIVFDDTNWNVFQTIAVIAKRATWLGSNDREYAVVLAVADPANSDIAYRRAPAAVVTNAYRANAPPRFGNYVLQIAENTHAQETAAGTGIGPPLLAVDRENHGISYRLEDASGLFGIDADTAQVSLTVAVNLDYEKGPNMYPVTVHAQDELSAASSAEFTIEVTNIDEPPRLTLENQKVVAAADFSYRLEIVEHGLPYLVQIAGRPEWLAYDGDSHELSAAAAVLAQNVGTYTISVQLASLDQGKVYDSGTFVLDVFRPGSLSVSGPTFLLRPDQPSTGIQVRLGSRPHAQPVTVAVINRDRASFDTVPDRLVFSVENWNLPQMVTVSVHQWVVDRLFNLGMFIRLSVDDPENSDIIYRDVPTLVYVGYYLANSLPHFQPYRLQIPENTHQEKAPAGTQVGAPLLAVDREGDELTYSLADSSGRFGIGSASAQVSLTVAANFDYEKGPSLYVITVSALDMFGESGTTTVTIEITNIDEPPRLSLTTQVAAAAVNFAYKPEVIEYGLPYHVRVADKPAWLEYDSMSGELRAAAAVLGQNIGAHTVSVQLVDSEQNTVYDSDSFTLSVVNHGRIVVADAPELKFGQMSVAFQVSLDGRAPTDPVIIAVSADELVHVSSSTLVFGTADWNAPQTIHVSMQEAALAQNLDTDFQVLLGPDRRRNNDIFYKYAPVTIVSGKYVANGAPRFGSHRLQVPENGRGEETLAGTAIGQPLTATDRENHRLAYSIEDVSGLFGIDPDSAQISLAIDADLDYESDMNVYMITVHAQDEFGARGQTAASIEVTDARELPYLGQLEDQLAVTGVDFIYFLDVIRDTKNYTYSSRTPEWLTFEFAGHRFDENTYVYIAEGEQLVAGVYTLTVQAFAKDDPLVVVDADSFVLTVLQGGVIEATPLPEFGLDLLLATVSARIDKAPSRNVTVNVYSTHTLAIVEPRQLTFAAENWNEYQLVTVSITPGVVQQNVDREFAVLLEVHEKFNADILYVGTPQLQLPGSYLANGVPEFGSVLLQQIPENVYEATSLAGTEVGSPLVATDREGDSMRYSLVGASDMFGIDAGTAQLTLKKAVNFDHERARGAHTVTISGDEQLQFARSAASYSVTVAATDRRGHSGLATIEIQIVDVNEPPRLGEIPDFRSIDNRHFTYRIDYAENAEIAQNSRQNRMLHSVTGLPAGVSHAATVAGIVLSKDDGLQPLSPGNYKVTVKAVDEQDSMLHDEKVFVLEILARGYMEIEGFPRYVYGRDWTFARVKISHAPDVPVTVTVKATSSENMETFPQHLVFAPDNWEQLQAVTVSLTREVRSASADLRFTVEFSVFKKSESDIRYRQTSPHRSSSEFRDSQIEFASQIITINEHAYDESTRFSKKIGELSAAIHLDDVAASLSYRINPFSTIFTMRDTEIFTRGDVNFNYEKGPQSYTIFVDAEDSQGGSASAEVQISIADINEVPQLGEIESRRAIIGHGFELTVAVATDEDIGQTHSYAAALADGSALPDWLEFVPEERKFSIAANATGLKVSVYQLSVSVADDGSPQLSAYRKFSLTVVEPGLIEAGSLPAFSRAHPVHGLSVRLSARPDQEVTVALDVADAAALSSRQLTFGSSDWSAWQTVQVSLSAATTVRKEDLDFTVTVAVHEAETTDELYLQTAPVRVAGKYEGPGNQDPQIAAASITISENAGNERTAAGSKIGSPLSATDADNDDASLTYAIDPVSGLFGIGEGDGQITLSVDRNFNYEPGPRLYTVTVQVEDPDGGSASAEVQISIADINEVPQLGEIESRRAIIGHGFVLTVAAATDEDAGQTHSYAAALADGNALPDWLGFVPEERKFSIAANATGLKVSVYQLSVSVADDGSPQLSAYRKFSLTVVEPGLIEAGSLPAFSRAHPVHGLSVRLSARPDQEVTVALDVADAAALSSRQLTFGSSDWSAWQTVQVSLSAATTVRKEDLDFTVTVAVHEAATADELYLQTAPVRVAGKYEGPGNQDPQIAAASITISENAGNAQTAAGSKIGSPLSATDADNDDASLTYAIDPASGLFGIGEGDGQITLSVATNFNYEPGPRLYTVTVQVEDPDGGSASAEVQIGIADINEAPQLDEIESRRVIIGRPFILTVAAATDEDVGQTHSYAAALADGGALPNWLGFVPAERKFSIAAGAPGVAVGVYQLSVSATDDGSPQLSGHRNFSLTVVEPGRIEAGSLPAFSRARPVHDLSVRLSAQPDQEVTVVLGVADAAALSSQQLTFGSSDWSVWQTVQVSLSAATTVRKEDLDFTVTVAVHEAATADELYLQTAPVRVAGKYEGPGNANPRISTTEVRVNENAGGQASEAGTRIGSPVSATDADNDDASLTYAIDPASDLFGIGESDGQITLSVATNFNYEPGPRLYTVTVQVKDPDGGTASGEVQISIADINEAPQLDEIENRRAIIGRPFALTVAEATDEDVGQTHSYSAALADGSALPGWLGFASEERKFSIAADAPGLKADVYQLSVSVADDGSPQLSAYRKFSLTVVEPGRIEAGSLPAFSRARPVHDLSVRLSAQPDQEVTVALSVADAAALSSQQLTFGSSDWSVWKTVQVSLSAATTVRKEDLDFTVTVAVHEAATADELYLQTAPVRVAGKYEGPGNQDPQIAAASITISENAGNAQTAAGSKIGSPLSATDADNDDASLTYAIDPASGLFGIGEGDGQITLSVDRNFNYEPGPRLYTVTVQVEDPDGGSASAQVQIGIADINEAPQLDEIGNRRVIIGRPFILTVAAATDEDVGQTHSYAAAMADGSALPDWIGFSAPQRRFAVAARTAGEYRISVSVTDDGRPPLGAGASFVLTVVAPGHIETGKLPVFSRSRPRHGLSVRLGAAPERKVTVYAEPSDPGAASTAPAELVFGPGDWNKWQTVQVSVSAATQLEKGMVEFSVEVGVRDRESSDELYEIASQEIVQASYEGPGNLQPQASGEDIALDENAGSAMTPAGSKIGAPVSATDEDNDDALLAYSIDPASSLFGIGENDGQITLSVDRNFNYELGPRTYSVTVVIRDSDDGRSSVTVAIAIEDVNEAPQLAAIADSRAVIGRPFALTVAEATDEDVGQTHSYAAALADGGALPNWLGFVPAERKFSIAAGAPGVAVGVYQLSVSATDDGSPQLSGHREFRLTVVEPGRIEAGSLPAFSRTRPVHDLSVRLSARPDQEVTVALDVADAAALSSRQLTFGSSDWSVWQTVQVSLSAATTVRKEDLDFTVTVAVHEAATADELYLQTAPVRVAGKYEGPGNQDPQIAAASITISENAGNAQTAAGSKIGSPLSATDADNDDASLTYAINPASDLFGIGENDGQITLSVAMNFNYEPGPRLYTVTVQVKDPDGGTASGEVQISIADINEAPQLDEIENRRAIIGRPFALVIAEATDEDIGQTHSYAAALADGSALPGWLGFVPAERKFSIAADAPGVGTGVYQLSVSATDDGSPQLSGHREFSLTVVAPGRIEAGSLPTFSRTAPSHDLSVRLSAQPDHAVTLTVSVLGANAATVVPLTMIFAPERWNQWQTTQVSISSATAARKEDLPFSVAVEVVDLSGGEGIFDTNTSAVDILYRDTPRVTVQGRYEGPGNQDPQIAAASITISENAGNEQTAAGSKIGSPLLATDADNGEEELSYRLAPAASPFGIGKGNGQITLSVATNFNYESGPRLYTVTVQVKDPDGGSASAEVQIGIADINEAPQLAAIADSRAVIGRPFALTVAAAADEDAGQTHSYAAALADGSALPDWLGFAPEERKFSIAAAATGLEVGVYQLSVSATDDGSPQLSGHREFRLTVVAPGRIEAGSLPAFSRTRPVHDLSVRLGDQPDDEVTLTLSVADAAALSFRQLTFGSSNWNAWQTVQVSLLAATTVRKEDLDFTVTVAVHEAATADELYVNASPVQVAGKYEGPGNANPRISTTEVRVNENAGGQESNAGTRIGSPVSATDADNDDASLTYAIDPASGLFGIGESDGQISLSVATNFNYEPGPRLYTVTVQVEDPDGGSTSARVQISIADINEAPQLDEIGNRRVIIGRPVTIAVAAATDEDAGQTHSYSAALADGSALPDWIGFSAPQRRFAVAARTAGEYRISVSVTDDGRPPLGAGASFVLTVVAPGHIETGKLPVFSRSRPRHGLSIRLSAAPERKVTVYAEPSDPGAASTAPAELVFGPGDWNKWQTVQVSVSAATQLEKGMVEFSVEVGVRDRESSDELYEIASQEIVQASYEGPGNLQPQASGEDIVLDENAGSAMTPAGSKIGAPVSATDEDNDDALLAYSIDPASDLFGIGENDGQITLSVATNFNYELGPRTYSVTVVIRDPDDGRSSVTVAMAIADINEAPQLDEIGNWRAVIGRPFALTVAEATDEDVGQTHSYAAALADGGALPGWLGFVPAERKFSIAADATGVAVGVYQLSVSATDDGSPQLSGHRNFSLTVVAPGRIEAGSLPAFSRTRPVHDLSVRLSAQPDQEVTVALDVADAAALSSRQLTFGSSDWSVWQTVQVSLSAATTVRKEDLAFTVTVAVHEAATTDELYVNATPVRVAGRYAGPGNANPRLLTDEIVLNENSGDFLTAVGTPAGAPVSATDPDNDDASLTYAISPASDLFGMEEASGQVTVKDATNFDYEPGPRLYTVTVQVEDPDGGSASGEVKVRIADINERPFLPEIADQAVVLGNELDFVAAPATDEDVGQTHRYVVQQAGGEPRPAWLLFDAAARRLSMAGDDARIEEGEYSLEMIVYDSGSPVLSASRRFRLQVQAGGRVQAQPITGMSAQNRTVDLLVRISIQPQVAVTITLIDQQPQVANAGPSVLVFEPDSWNVYQTATVRAADETVARDESADYAIVLAVHDPSAADSLYRSAPIISVPGLYYGSGNEPPVVQPLTVSIYENRPHELTPAGTFIGEPVAVSDPDHGARELTYELTDDSGLFEIESQAVDRGLRPGRSDSGASAMPGQISLKEDYGFDYEFRSEYGMTVLVRDPAGGQAQAMVKVGIIDLPEQDNQAPHLAATVFYVDENIGEEQTPAGTVIGAAISAEDADNRGDEISYSIIGSSDIFRIVHGGGTATIVTGRRMHFDYETVPSYALTIAATDPHGAVGVATISIVLNDLVEEFVESTDDRDSSRQPLLIGYVDRAINAAVVAMVRNPPAASRPRQPERLSGAGNPWAESAPEGGEELARAKPFEALLRHDFGYTLAAGGAHGSIARAWSSGSRTSLDAAYFSDDLSYDGAVSTGIAGFEIETAARGRRIGMAVSFADADFDFVIGGDSIKVERDVFMLYPYIYWDVSPKTRIWGLLGLGSGDYRSGEADSYKARMFAFDGGLDYRWEYDDFDLAVALESANTSSWLVEGADEFTASDAETFRSRALFEVARPFAWEGHDFTLRPFARVQARLDRGDAGRKMVADLSGGTRLHWGAGLQIDIDGMVQINTSESRQSRVRLAIAYDFANDGHGLLLEMDSSVEGGDGNDSNTISRVGSRIGWGRPTRFFGATGDLVAQIRMEDDAVSDWGWSFQAQKFGFSLLFQGESEAKISYSYRL